MSLKDRRAIVFSDTRNVCEHDAMLQESIACSVTQQTVAGATCNISIKEYPKGGAAALHINSYRTLEAVVKAKEEFDLGRVAVHNFASARHPGGGVLTGAGAQEECLCRSSTLYFCLNSNLTTKLFYSKHNQLIHSKQMDSRYNDDLIYTPDVTVFKTDEELPKLLPMSQWYSVDVISCAAPNLRDLHLPNDEVLGIHKRRLGKVCRAAIVNHVDTIVLGAFGCGTFKNDPSIVSRAALEVVKEYSNYFKHIIFAVYCNDNEKHNYNIFKLTLKEKL